MSNQKILGALLIASVLLLVGVGAQAEDAKQKTPVEYTKEQKACINKVQIKGIQDAQEIFKNDTKDALQAKQDAIREAQQLKDETARTNAIQEASDAYNNSDVVKTARDPYVAAIKTARDNAIKKCIKQGSFFENIIKAISNTTSAISASLKNKDNSPKKAAQVTITEKQKECIKLAQQKMANTLKPAREAMQNATKDALKIKQDAIREAQQIKDETARTTAIKTASVTYNNSDVVKTARAPYSEAVKAANEQFKKDQKDCVSNKTVGSPAEVFKNMGKDFSNFGQRIKRFFTGKE